MNKNTKSAVYLSFSGELKKVSYAVGAIMVANHVFGWFDSTRLSLVLSGVWFVGFQFAAHYLVYLASNNDETPGTDTG